MRILNVAYPLLPVGPDSAGGAEQILYLLERGLVTAGHQSLVVAAAGSQVCGELIETPCVNGAITEEVRRSAQIAHRLAIHSALAKCKVDVVHFHGLDFAAYVPSQRLPKLATLHLPLDWYPSNVLETNSLHFNCVSQTQAASAASPAKLSVVVNGIDLDSYRLDQGRRSFLLWLGRICPEKGVHHALRVAHRLEVPMVVAGPVHPFQDHKTYFADLVRPELDEKRRYIGPVGLKQKIALLSQARCLLIPSLVAETSSLVVMEAFASGTPVIAYRSGALPEIVAHESTGFVVDSEDEMVEAAHRISEISPAVCRREAETRFNSKRMVSDYVNLYRIIAA